MATYVSKLRELAEFCEFEATLENMLRDRLVCGINNDAIQRRLLSEAELTFKKAMELALGMETAAKNMKEIQSGSEARGTEVHKIHTTAGSMAPPGLEVCYRSGRSGHKAMHCRFKDKKCHNCGKIGHLARVCRSKPKKPAPTARPQKSVKLVQEPAEEELEEYSLFNCTSPRRAEPLEVDLQVEGQPTTMEVDTGAALSIVSEATYRRLWPQKTLQESRVKLHTYTGEPLNVLGSVEMDVHYQDQLVRLPLQVVQGNGPSLIGRGWLQHIRLDWRKICTLSSSLLENVLQQHSTVFREGLGTLEGFKAKIYVDPAVTPKFCKARPVPFAMRAKVEAELDHLVQQGILTPVQHAEWAAPIVPVLKRDKESVRICGDFKCTVN